MAKYEPLKQFLLVQDRERVPMTFAEIERVISIKLPRSADCYRAWWSNNPSNNVMTQAWLEAGYETEQVDLPGRKLVFRRVGRFSDQKGSRAPGGAAGKDAQMSGFAEPTTPVPMSPARKPGLFGWLRGTVGMAAGVDLTAPADAGWGKQAGDQQFPVGP